MRPKPFAPFLLVAVIGLTLLCLPACRRKAAVSGTGASPLFTGKEAKKKAVLVLPQRSKAGFTTVNREIYATVSSVNQAKQVLLALMAGPAEKGPEAAMLPVFGPNATFTELYLDGKGLAVLDLPSSTLAGLPGGTSAEVQTLYCLLRTLGLNAQVQRLQVLVDGKPAESLRGHVDLQDPLTLTDF